MKPGKDDDAGRVVTPSWQSALLVCNACRKRGSGPRGVKTKAVVGEAKRLLRASRPRARVVTTTCLGLCPKGAVAVAMVDAQRGATRIVAVDTLKSLNRLLPLLVEPPVAASAEVSLFGANGVSPPPAASTADSDELLAGDSSPPSRVFD